MAAILERLAAGEVLLADGALGTMLMARGLAPGHSPERFNLEHPEVLEEIARSYRTAGSHLVSTNTFGASPLKLAAYGLDERCAEVNRGAVDAVRRAVGDAVCVAASCGSGGRLLQPYGDASAEEVRASFRAQFEVLAQCGVDIVFIETMTDVNEAEIAVQEARGALPATPIAATMTFDATPRDFRTIMGASVTDAIDRLTAAGADILGSNCGYGIEFLTEVAREFRAHTERPLLIQPNAGLPQLRDGAAFYPETPEFMAEKLPALLDCGVNLVGGCCGTTPAHIAAMRKVIDSRAVRPGGR